MKYEKQFSHLFNFVSYQNSETGELVHSVQIYTSKNGIYKDFKEELDLVVDRLNNFDDEGNLIIDVFDHYLSEYGNTVHLIATKNGKWRIAGRWNTIIEPTTLKKCFEYIREHRYYE